MESEVKLNKKQWTRRRIIEAKMKGNPKLQGKNTKVASQKTEYYLIRHF